MTLALCGSIPIVTRMNCFLEEGHKPPTGSLTSGGLTPLLSHVGRVSSASDGLSASPEGTRSYASHAADTLGR